MPHLEICFSERVEKRVDESQNAPAPMDKTFKMRLSHIQAEQLTAKGFAVSYADQPIRHYFVEVNTDDLLKILPR